MRLFSLDIRFITYVPSVYVKKVNDISYFTLKQGTGKFILAEHVI